MIDKRLKNELFQMAFVTIITTNTAICKYGVLIIMLFYFSIPLMFRLQKLCAGYQIVSKQKLSKCVQVTSKRYQATAVSQENLYAEMPVGSSSVSKGCQRTKIGVSTITKIICNEPREVQTLKMVKEKQTDSRVKAQSSDTKRVANLLMCQITETASQYLLLYSQ